MKISIYLNYLSIIISLVASENAKYWDEKLSKCQGIDIREMSIQQVHEFYHGRNLTSVELTKCYLERIYKLNPYLNAVLEVNPDALEIAKELDLFFESEEKLKGPLHGVPILLKDIFDTCDKMNTTSGSLALLGSKPKEDAEVVELLRKAGAIILGKTNLSEFSGFQSTDAPLGWSNRGGQTKNPYNLIASPGGSSSGSAVAVAANLALVSLGSDTTGSTIGPASLNSVVGLKTSVGSVSTKGVIPSVPTQDSVGIISRSIVDNIAVTYTIAQTFLRDTLDSIYDFDPKKNNSSLKKVNQSFKIGVLQDSYLESSGLPEEQLNVLDNVINHLSFSNIETRNVTMSFSALSPEGADNVIFSEIKYYFNEYLKKRTANTKSNITCLLDIINYNKELPKSQYPYNQDLLELAQNTNGIDSISYEYDRNENIKSASEPIIAAIETYKLDAFIVPSYSNLADEIPNVIPITMAGFPMITVPVGVGADGVPFGISVFGVKDSESTIIQIASIISQYYQRGSPKFLQ